MACKLVKYRKQKPYNADGKTNFRYTERKSGVYLIYKNDALVYVGFSASNVYKTMYRHFQSWDDPTQIRVTYKNAKRANSPYSCRVVLTSPARAAKLEKLLIVKYKPKDNPNKYTLYSPTKADSAAIREYLGAKVESCPF